LSWLINWIIFLISKVTSAPSSVKPSSWYIHLSSPPSNFKPATEGFV
jgi:hypothetical protein